MRLLPSRLNARLVLLLLLVLLPLLAVLAWNGLQRRRQAVDSVRASALDIARLVAQSKERRLEGARQFLLALAQSREVRGGSAAECSAYLKSLVSAQQGTYNDIGVADVHGRILCGSSSSAATVADRPYFTRAIASGRFSVGDYMLGKTTKLQRIAFSYPIRSDAGELTGVVFASINLDLFSENLREQRVVDHATLTLLDRNGTILARSQDAAATTGTTIPPEQLALIRRDEGVGELEGPDGIRRIYGMAMVRDDAGTPVLFVRAGLRSDVALAAIDRSLVIELGLLLLLGTAIGLVVWFSADRLVRRPVAELLGATSAIARGELDTRTRHLGGVLEFQELARAFNEMAHRVQQRDLHLRQGQRLEAIGQLAGGIAHDFNNILTVILGYGQSVLARMRPASEDAQELGEMLDAAERATRLTRQLLAFSRQQTLQARPVLLNEIVARTQSMLTRVIGEDIRLVTDLHASGGVVLADPAQLEQVILNLAINARDAMPDGGTLTIATSIEPLPADADTAMPAGEYVRLTVVDTGSGMDETTRARIFEPFFSTKGARGTGLGLATVYGIVKQSGGHISCSSEPGRGAAFAVFLPRTSAPAEDLRAPEAARYRRGTERVLVVEDEPALRELLSRVLGTAGYDVTVLENGEQALGWLTHAPKPPDAIITDVVMPGMRGTALYKQVVERNPEMRVLFISGYAADAMQVDQVPAGLSFLQKPFTPADLLRQIRDLLDGSAPVAVPPDATELPVHAV